LPSAGPVNRDFSAQIQHAEMLIISLSGAEVFRKEYKLTDRIQLNLSNYTNGMYPIRLNLDGNHDIRKVVLKN